MNVRENHHLPGKSFADLQQLCDEHKLPQGIQVPGNCKGSTLCCLVVLFCKQLLKTSSSLQHLNTAPELECPWPGCVCSQEKSGQSKPTHVAVGLSFFHRAWFYWKGWIGCGNLLWYSKAEAAAPSALSSREYRAAFGTLSLLESFLFSRPKWISGIGNPLGKVGVKEERRAFITDRKANQGIK